MADMQKLDDSTKKKMFSTHARGNFLGVLSLSVLLLIDWGIIPLGMQGNLIVRFCIAGLLAFELFSAFAAMMSSKRW